MKLKLSILNSKCNISINNVLIIIDIKLFFYIDKYLILRCLNIYILICHKSERDAGWFGINLGRFGISFQPVLFRNPQSDIDQSPCRFRINPANHCRSRYVLSTPNKKFLPCQPIKNSFNINSCAPKFWTDASFILHNDYPNPTLSWLAFSWNIFFTTRRIFVS